MQFGVEDVIVALSNHNVKLLVVNDDLPLVVSQQRIYNLGGDISLFGERDELLLIEYLLEIALKENIELVVVQSSHVKYAIGQFGGFYSVDRY